MRDGEACDDAGKPSGGAYVISLLQKEFGRLGEKGCFQSARCTGRKYPGEILLELKQTVSYLDIIRIEDDYKKV